MATSLIWGMAEATVLFILPDVYLGFIGLFNWRRGLLATVYAGVGAVIGGTVMYLLAGRDGSAMARLLTSVPLISPEMLDSVAQQVRASGLSAVFWGPSLGIPYKIYAVEAGRQHLPYLPFVVISLAARMPRFVLVAALGAATGEGLRPLVVAHTKLIVGAYVLAWLVVYVLYALSVT